MVETSNNNDDKEDDKENWFDASDNKEEDCGEWNANEIGVLVMSPYAVITSTICPDSSFRLLSESVV